MSVKKGREAAEGIILKYIEKMLPGSPNTQNYKDMFARMSDAEFTEFIKNGHRLAVVVSNGTGVQAELERNLEIADELGHNFFQRIWLPTKDGKGKYLTPHSYIVVDLPHWRQAQVLSKKISIPEDNSTVNNLTGQVTGKSKGSRISHPQLLILDAAGLSETITELIKYRGGDLKGLRAMNTSIARTGGVELKAIEPYSGTVQSTQTLSVIFTSMHLKNTLLHT